MTIRFRLMPLAIASLAKSRPAAVAAISLAEPLGIEIVRVGAALLS